MQKISEVFFVFRTFLNDLYQTIVHLNTLTHPLRKLLQIKVDFHWTGTCNEAFGKLKLCMNSDPASVILTSRYREYSLHRRNPIWGISAILLQKRKNKQRRP